jgi:drug/metabolite transporter (DMT)-like permease
MAGAGLLRLGVLGALGGVAFICAMNLAVSLVGPTVAGFVATLYAVVAALLAVPLLGERLRPGTVVAFLVALVGTALLAGFQPLDAPVAGVGFALVAALTFGLYLVLSRRWTATHGLDGTSIALANLVGRGPVLLAAQLILGPGALAPAVVDPTAALALVGLALIPSTASQLLIVASVRRVATRRTSASLLLTPLTGAVLSAALLEERLTPGELLGGALVVLGIAGASGLLTPLRARIRQLGAAMSRRGNAQSA